MFRFAIIVLLCSGLARAQVKRDRITSLPDQPELKSAQYAGYIPLDAQRHAFYWFVESQNDPINDPLVLWLNGGPGCSSLLGLLTENGPTIIRHSGEFFNNVYTWARNANMLFLESPPGVGFSVDATPPTAWNDTITAHMNYKFLVNWLAVNPSFVGRPLYITGESYAGHYVPQLAYEILHGSDTRIRNMMQGMMVGNPCTGTPNGDDRDWCFIDDPTQNEFYRTHAYMPFDRSLEGPGICCTGDNVNCKNSPHCFERFDPYDVLARFCNDDVTGRVVRWDHKGLQQHKILKDQRSNPRIPPQYGPCNADHLETYLRRDDVMKAIHAQPGIKWSMCSPINYPTPPTTAGVLKQYTEFMNKTTWKILIFSGDADAVVNFIQTEKVIISLGRKALTNFTPWYYADPYNQDWEQVGGWYVQYDRISWASVKGSGHMVPMYTPPQALQLFTSFMQTGGPGSDSIPFGPADEKCKGGNSWLFVIGLFAGMVACAIVVALVSKLCRGQSK